MIAADFRPAGGIGQPFNPPSFPGCLSIFIASDSEGRIGHECPKCQGFWRSGGAPARWPMTCPYCGIRLEAHRFLTKGQRRYFEACCELIANALNADQDGEKTIDMDASSDATLAKTERPKFYYAEQTQETRFNCAACGEWNDILGRSGYCSSCGTRNDLAQLDALIATVRTRINTPNEPDLNACVCDLVSAFDTMAQQYAKQLIEFVPVTPRRKARFQGRFHDLRRSAKDFSATFDIKPLEGIDEDTVKFAVMMFERRHVYEHKGGEADEAYVEKSGDSRRRSDAEGDPEYDCAARRRATGLGEPEDRFRQDEERDPRICSSLSSHGSLSPESPLASRMSDDLRHPT